MSYSHVAIRRTAHSVWITVLLAVVVTACSAQVPAEPTGTSPASPAPSSAGPGQPSPDTSTLPADPQPPADGLLAPANLRAVLVAAGVQLVADDGTTVMAGPAGTDVPLILLDASIDRLSVQAASQMGVLGSTLDELGGGAPTALPPSVLLSAYALGVETDGANVARAALGQQDLTDPKSVIFPTLVFLLFAADAVHEIGDEAAATAIVATGLTTAPPGPRIVNAEFKPCSLFSSLVYGSINKVFDKLHIPPGRVGATGSRFLDSILQAVTDVVVAGLNIIIEAGRTLVINTARLLLADVVTLIAEASSIAALVGSVLSNVDPISLIADPQPGQITRTTVPVTATVTLSAHVLGPDEWPGGLDDCAFVSTGSHLPPLKPVGSPVTWTVYESPSGIGLAVRSTTATSEDVLSASAGRDAEARLVLESKSETAEQVKQPPRNGLVKITGAVHRTGLDKVQKALVQLTVSAAGTFTNKLPEPFKGYIDRLLAGAVEGATNGLTTLLDTKTWTFLSVIYHGEPSPSLKPPTPGPSAGLLPLPNPCALITQAEASEAAGYGVEPGVQVPTTIDDLGSGLGCPFRNPATGITANVRINALDLGGSAAQTFATYEQVAEGAVAGLGDDNFYLPRGPDGATILLVRKRNIVLMVSVLTANGLEQATRLARLALGRF